MKIGLIGFGGSGKSTLLNSLAGGKSAGGSGSGKARVATVTHAGDVRLCFLTDLYRPKKVTPLSFEMHDYPGMPFPGGADTAFRAAEPRDEVDGLLLVVRGFRNDAWFYPRPAADPSTDARDLVQQIIMSDLEVVTRGVERLEVTSRKPTPKQEEEKRRLALLSRVQGVLEGERPVKEMDLTSDEELILRGYRLLSQKPWFLLVNLGDEGAEVAADAIDGPFEGSCEVRVKLEAELLELTEEERSAFMEELEIDDLQLPGLLEGLLLGLGMLRFYTVGEKEVHVWELERGGTAVAAAGKIHTDLARGFIRAEVVTYHDIFSFGDMNSARAAGRVRLEGKDYVVSDGDILDVRFSI